MLRVTKFVKWFVKFDSDLLPCKNHIKLSFYQMMFVLKSLERYFKYLQVLCFEFSEISNRNMSFLPCKIRPDLIGHFKLCFRKFVVNWSYVPNFWAIPFWKALFKIYNSYLQSIFELCDLSTLNLEILEKSCSDSVLTAHFLIVLECITYPILTSLIILEGVSRFSSTFVFCTF